MSNYVLDTSAAKAIDVFVILKGGEYVGKILAYSSQSTCLVNIFQIKKPFQSARARGIGFNKLNAALCGLTFGDITLEEDSPDQLIRHGYTVIRAI